MKDEEPDMPGKHEHPAMMYSTKLWWSISIFKMMWLWSAKYRLISEKYK